MEAIEEMEDRAACLRPMNPRRPILPTKPAGISFVGARNTFGVPPYPPNTLLLLS
jgi:hypothetical protein